MVWLLIGVCRWIFGGVLSINGIYRTARLNSRAVGGGGGNTKPRHPQVSWNTFRLVSSFVFL